MRQCNDGKMATLCESSVYIYLNGWLSLLSREDRVSALVFQKKIFFLNHSFVYLFYLSIFGCVGSSLLCEGFLQLGRAGATLHSGAWAPQCRGLSCCGAQAPDPQAQYLWPTGPAAPRHVGSSQTRARTRVPCISRQTPNHCATREALKYFKRTKILTLVSLIAIFIFLASTKQ